MFLLVTINGKRMKQIKTKAKKLISKLITFNLNALVKLGISLSFDFISSSHFIKNWGENYSASFYFGL